jgi:hypothetical protein
MSVFGLLESLRDMSILTSKQSYIRQIPGGMHFYLDHNSMSLAQVHIPIVSIALYRLFLFCQ